MVGYLVSQGSVDLIKPRKTKLRVVIWPSHFGRGLFCYYNFIIILY